MKRNRIALGLAAALVALVAATAALAAGPNGKVVYRFVGQLRSAPSGSSLSVSVQAGNRHALRAMLGQSQVQTFTTGQQTVFLKWSNGVPTVVASGDLAQGDRVAINIRAARGATLAELLATAPGIVGDHGTTWNNPSKPLYSLPRHARPSAAGAVTVDVRAATATRCGC
jgi:hypothetical protein